MKNYLCTLSGHHCLSFPLLRLGLQRESGESCCRFGFVLCTFASSTFFFSQHASCEHLLLLPRPKAQARVHCVVVLAPFAVWLGGWVRLLTSSLPPFHAQLPQQAARMKTPLLGLIVVAGLAAGAAAATTRSSTSSMGGSRSSRSSGSSTSSLLLLSRRGGASSSPVVFPSSSSSTKSVITRTRGGGPRLFRRQDYFEEVRSYHRPSAFERDLYQ